jgi:Uma2 family endonuclease
VKFDLYARAGVAEYWIIDAENRLVEVHALRGQAYVPLGAFGPEDTTCSELLPTFAPTVSTICGDTIA